MFKSVLFLILQRKMQYLEISAQYGMSQLSVVFSLKTECACHVYILIKIVHESEGRSTQNSFISLHICEK